MKSNENQSIIIDFSEKAANNADRVCVNCGVTYMIRLSRPICPSCYEEVLFADVRKFIQDNDVTEFEVANKFNIPIRLVKKWIRQGRVSYKENKLSPARNKCRTCGTAINFGNYCCDCLKLLTTNEVEPPHTDSDFIEDVIQEQIKRVKGSYMSFF